MTLLFGVLLASLAGSVHCAAMCGAFVCAYAAPRAPAHAQGTGVHIAYHGGRLTSYLLLGAIAGAMGAGFDRVGALAGVGRGAALVAGALMIVWAASEIARLGGIRLPMNGGVRAGELLSRMLATQRDRPAWRRALTLGLLTTLIPCGWLYAFVATAAATGTAAAGIVVMAVFWLGTVPMLVAVALSARRFVGGPARRWPVAAAMTVLVLGLLTISGRIRPIQPAAPAGVHVGH